MNQSEKRVIRQLLEALLFERLIAYTFDDGVFCISCQDGSEMVIHGRKSAFGRIRLDIGTIRGASGNLTFNEILDLLSITEPFKDELNRTAHFSADSPILDHRRMLNGDRLDSALSEGHPYHPSFKSRIGFTQKDHRCFGPEYGQSFPVMIAAFPKAYLQQSFPDEKTFFLKEFGTQAEYWLKQCPEGSALMPVHPWQWQHFEHELEAEGVVPIGFTDEYYYASQSVRTLWHPDKNHVKLSMNMKQTSSMRTIQPENALAAPHVSGWLSGIVENDQGLEGVKILKEYASCTYESDRFSGGEFSAIWRESPESFCSRNESVIPMNALAVEEQGDVFAGHWIQTFGAEAWVRQLIRCFVIPVLHLFIRHGVAIEAHAQNSLLVLENGWPKRIMLRDFHDSVEYCHHFLADPADLPDFKSIHPSFNNWALDEYYEMSSPALLTELITDTLFVYHLSDFSYALERHQYLKEDRFWEIVHEEIVQWLDCHPDCQKRMDCAGLLKKEWTAESLLASKWGIDQTLCVHNPFADQRERLIQHVSS
ncbi:IucA/IucC family siderophore biosynthesis protein [Jeotgalibacillus sp. R-1-5s-1]|uniref:IucA/IucC family protein n=1 Tax=Jeotgalibacillus sp. R-1-5s-1 TaxID=2555897 RepID=UPI001068E2BD|nr:IucA/IucC family protein [Jeotgalibacillus sp. R-1-5s-1]TFD99680.1 siderophore biosynthesis protein [Jeotgalibacillus sp. R-1-5s-1]